MNVRVICLLVLVLLGSPVPMVVAQSESPAGTGVVAEQAPNPRTQSKTWWVVPSVGSLTQSVGSMTLHLPEVNLASFSERVRNSLGSVIPASFSMRLADLHSFWVTVRPLIELALDQVQKNFVTLQRWEYRVVEVADPAPDALEKQLNTLGNDGWECISLVPSTTGTRCTFKRKPMSRFRAGMQILSLLLSGSAAGTSGE